MGIKSFLQSKSNNIGSLCSLIRNNEEYLNFINDKIIDLSLYNLTLSEKLYYFFNNIESPLLCSCGSHLKYIGFKNGYRVSCGKKECYIKSRKITNIKKYGVDNPMKNKYIKNKVKNTIYKKYNGKHYMYDEIIKEKIKKTNLDRYGVEYVQQNGIISEKTKSTWKNKDQEELNKINDKRKITNKNKTDENKKIIELKKKNSKIRKYGSLKEYNKIVQQKIKRTSLERYGIEHFFKNKDIQNKRIETYQTNKIKKIIKLLPNSYRYINVENNENKTDTYLNIHHDLCNNDFKITRQLFYKRIGDGKELCLKCNPISNGVSKMEKEIVNYINKYVNVVENYKISNKEIDIYIPELKLGIEFNGLYWHSELYKDEYYHKNKTNFFNDIDISIFHIWEDQWIYKKEIIKSMILNKLDENLIEIHNKETIVKEIKDDISVRNFLNENHLQGFVESKIEIGLFHNNKLVSIMTFGHNQIKNQYEIVRFCNKKFTNIIGGFSKLFYYFIENYKVKEIIFYASRDHCDKNFYEKLKFELIKITDPNYFYIDKKNYLRMDKSNFRKDILVKEGFNSSMSEHEIMLSRNIYRIYNSGDYIFKYTKL